MQPDAIENHTIPALPNDPEHQKYQRVSNEGSVSLEWAGDRCTDFL
jgi:hypothetical protein